MELSGSSSERVYDVLLLISYDDHTRYAIVGNLYDLADKWAKNGIVHNPFLPDNELLHEFKKKKERSLIWRKMPGEKYCVLYQWIATNQKKVALNLEIYHFSIHDFSEIREHVSVSRWRTMSKVRSPTVHSRSGKTSQCGGCR